MRRLTNRIIITVILLVLIWISSTGVVFPSDPEIEIVINLPAFTLYVYQGDELIKQYPIGIGSSVNPSLLGETQIINNVTNPTYYPPDWYLKGLEPIPPGPDNPVGTRWLGLGFKGYGIHGTNQPESIGRAMSAGCIRMHNADVEELARMVRIGTRVTFIYETVYAWQDPDTGHPHVLIYPDVYRQGTNRIESVLDAISSFPLPGLVDTSFLSSIIRESAGLPRPVPQAVPMSLNDEPFSPSATLYQGEVLVPVTHLSSALGRTLTINRVGERQVLLDGRVLDGAVIVGNHVYASPALAARTLGLMVESDRTGVRLRQVRVQTDLGLPLDLTTFVDDHDLWLPALDIAKLFGLPVSWDGVQRVVSIDKHTIQNTRVLGSKAFVTARELEKLLGIRITWSPGEKTARISAPRVRIRESGTTDIGFLYSGEVFVPIRMITDFLGVTLGWSEPSKTVYIQGVPVQGVVRGGRAYAPIQSLAEVIPNLSFRWNDEMLDLELSITRGS